MTHILGITIAAAIFLGLPTLSSEVTSGPVASEVRAGGRQEGLTPSTPPVVSLRTVASLPSAAATSNEVRTARTITIPRGDPATTETSQDPATLITLAAHEFGVDPAWLLRVAHCESRFDVNAIGDSGRSLGLMQFQAATFVGYSRISGLGYTLADLTDPESQARLAAWAFANGRSKAWTCA